MVDGGKPGKGGGSNTVRERGTKLAAMYSPVNEWEGKRSEASLVNEKSSTRPLSYSKGLNWATVTGRSEIKR